MKNKYKFMIICLSLIMLLFVSGITYSIFNSGADLTTNDVGIAKFIFNSEKTNHIEIPLIDILPGDEKEYAFSVSNNNVETLSNVSIGYQITIKTYHFIPLDIKLYKVTEDEELVLSCDEEITNNRSDDNKLIWKTEEVVMDNDTPTLDNYLLRVSFPTTFKSSIYSNLVDYLELEIRSWQKTGGR